MGRSTWPLIFFSNSVIYAALCWHDALHGSLAQSVEQRAFNPLVLRSNRRRPIHNKNNINIKTRDSGMRLLALFVTLICFQQVFAFSCEDHRPIIQKPIIFNQARLNLTREYQSHHYGIESSSIKIDPKMIVLHWSMYPTFSSTYQAFYPAILSHKVRPDLPGKLNVSAHFVVDRDGTIYQLMPDNWTGRHVVGLNHYAIGIENVGGVDDVPDLTQQQIESNAYLVCHLKKKYPSIQYLIGHMEYFNFKQSPLWLERHFSSTICKKDPGKAFLQKVKSLTSHLKLADKPV